MSYLLNIHTTTETAIINMSKDSGLIATMSNTSPASHAAFLHTAIHQILRKNDIQPFQLAAVGVTGGPGSYTGIRVGLATAKGLCYGLQIPLLVFNTLEVMAFSVIEKATDTSALYCPMIDARRMEVFTAVYNHDLQTIKEPAALILTEDPLAEIPDNTTVYYFGNGSEKYRNLMKNTGHSRFIDEELSSASLARFSWKKFQANEFKGISDSHPIYIKDFYAPARNR